MSPCTLRCGYHTCRHDHPGRPSPRIICTARRLERQSGHDNHHVSLWPPGDHYTSRHHRTGCPNDGSNQFNRRPDAHGGGDGHDLSRCPAVARLCYTEDISTTVEQDVSPCNQRDVSTGQYPRALPNGCEPVHGSTSVFYHDQLEDAQASFEEHALPFPHNPEWEGENILQLRSLWDPQDVWNPA